MRFVAIRQYYTPIHGHTMAPTVELTISIERKPKKVVTVNCLLDSGADLSILNFEVAQVLGLKRPHAVLETIRGFGGNTRILSFPQEDFVGEVGDDGNNHRFSMTPRFHEPGVRGMQVLGRLDFFAAFKRVEIHERSKYVDLYP